MLDALVFPAVDWQVAKTWLKLCLCVSCQELCNLKMLPFVVWSRIITEVVSENKRTQPETTGADGRCVVFAGARPAHDACFEDVNAAGNAFGNCGKDEHGNFMKCQKR